MAKIEDAITSVQDHGKISASREELYRVWCLLHAIIPSRLICRSIFCSVSKIYAFIRKQASYMKSWWIDVKNTS